VFRTAPRQRRRSVLLALFLLVLFTGGIATATWLVEGHGPARAEAATVESLTVASATPTSWLWPGTQGALFAEVDNPNPFPVRVTTVRLGEVTTTPQDGATCPEGTVTTAPGTVTLPAPVDVPANASGVPVTVPGAVVMTDDAENGCQGATFTVEVTLSAVAAG
jgi:hypothetical protein